MYDINKLRMSDDLLVKDFICELEKENPFAKVVSCGTDRVFIHANNDYVCIDNENLSDDYNYDERCENPPVIEKNQKVGSITLHRAYELLNILLDQLFPKGSGEREVVGIEQLEELGFTPEELQDLGFIIFKEEPEKKKKSPIFFYKN